MRTEVVAEDRQTQTHVLEGNNNYRNGLYKRQTEAVDDCGRETAASGQMRMWFDHFEMVVTAEIHQKVN